MPGVRAWLDGPRADSSGMLDVRLSEAISAGVARLKGLRMTTTTLALTAFLEQRIAEDEAAARAACRPRPEFGRPDEWVVSASLPSEVMGPMESVAGTKSATAAAHIARHDPARVLAECAAKRAIVALADEATGIDMSLDLNAAVGPRTEPYIGDQILRALAAVYSDHADFQEAWRA